MTVVGDSRVSALQRRKLLTANAHASTHDNSLPNARSNIASCARICAARAGTNSSSTVARGHRGVDQAETRRGDKQSEISSQRLEHLLAKATALATHDRRHRLVQQE
jgi:hypothetical protein